MKKILLAVLMTVVTFSSISCDKVFTVYAQSLPVTKTLAWDANAAADAVINYTVRLDGTVIGSPTGTTQAFTINAVGAHSLTVTATNIWGTSTPMTLNFNVVIPGVPSNGRIQ